MKRLVLTALMVSCLGAGKCNPCPSGYDWDGNLCCVPRPSPSPSPTIAPPDCPPGQEWDPTIKQCVPHPDPTPTPSPTAIPFECPRGQEWDPSIKQCVPHPDPTPTPLPPVIMPDCSIPPMKDCGKNDGPFEWGCCTQTGREGKFDYIVQAALDFVKQNPALVQDGKIVNETLYFNALVDKIKSYGICAQHDEGDNIAVKDTNDFNEQYDCYVGNAQAICFQAAVCKPARF